MFRKQSQARIGRRLVATALGAAAVAAAMAAAPAAAAESMKVRLGYQYTLWGAPAVVALETGLFKKHGLEIEARRFGAGKDGRDGVVAGSMDIATVGGTPFLVGAAVGELVAIGAVGYMGKTGCVMAKKGLPIKSVADLKGKKIASRRGSTIDNVLINKILPAHKLGPKEVEIVNIDFPDHVAAIAGGSTVAFAGVEPTCTIAEDEGIAVKVEDYFKYDLLPNMLTTRADYAAKNQKAVVAFLKAMFDSSAMFEKEPDKVADVLAKIYAKNNIPLPTLKNLLKTVVANPDYLPELPAYFADQADGLFKAGLIKTKDTDWNKVLLTDGLKAAKGSM